MENKNSVEEFYGLSCNLKGKLKFIEWDQKKKYEENLLAIDLRIIDLDGSLEIASRMDRNLSKLIPEVALKDGILYIKIKRGI